MSAKTAKKERYLFGIIGALLGAAIGGVVWFVLYQVGFIASISGFVAVFCAIKGYALFAGKDSVKGVVSAVIISALVMVAAWYLCVAHDIYNAYQDWYKTGECYYTLTYPECINSAWSFITNLEFADGSSYIDAESIRTSYLGDLGLGMLFCVIGAVSSVKQALARINDRKFYENQAAKAVEEAKAASAAAETAAEETAAEAEISETVVEDDGSWTCTKCGAKTEGDICEYCDSPREA